MKDKKMYILLVISILFAVVGVSLAFFSLNIIGNDKAKDTKITTGDLELVFTDDNEVSLDGAMPGDSITKTISVKNTGTKEVSYNIVWQELLNEITNNELVIDGTCKNLNSSNTEDGTCSAISKKAVKEGNITSNIPIKPGYTQEYEVKITFIDTGKLQNYNKNKSFKGKLGLTESSAKTIYCTFDGELTQGAEYVNGQYTYRYMQEGNIDNDDDGNDVYTWTNINTEGWGVTLTNKTNKTEANSNLCTYINDKPIVSMSYMFYKSQATSINLSNFNTSNVTNMKNMFNTTKIKMLDLNNFDTTNVLNMSGMFFNSKASISGLDNFNTNKVVDMSYMFSGQAGIIDVSNFDTSNVTNMSYMFFAVKVSTLDLSSFDTSNVKSTMWMFHSSSNLKTIYVSSKFNTNNITSSSNMFGSCTNLVGGAGTAYDENHTDAEYAHIDGDTSNPGYFTDIADKPVEPYSFSTDSWATIADAVKNNNISKYSVGDTKLVNLGTYGTHTVRIANTSTPSECSTDGFSQTACGFVIEFVDIIKSRKMNPSGEYNGVEYNYGWNTGGWPASEMYTFVNTDLYNSLPYILRNAIVDTITISGYGKNDTENFTSTDKLYLLSKIEVWGETASAGDTAKDLTRQLDYYKNLGVTDSNNYSEAIKKKDGYSSLWWLRTASSNDDLTFAIVNLLGKQSGMFANNGCGVSPAFRLG